MDSRSGGDDITVLERRVLLLRRDQPRDMRHITHQITSIRIRNLPQPPVIPIPRVRARPTDDQSGLEQPRILRELFIVDQTGLWVDSVREGLKVDGRGGDLLLGGVVAVGEMSTVGETESHDTVLRVDEGREGGKVGGGSGVGLDVHSPDGGVEVEGFEGTVSAEVLEDVDVLFAIPFA